MQPITSDLGRLSKETWIQRQFVLDGETLSPQTKTNKGSNYWREEK